MNFLAKKSTYTFVLASLFSSIQIIAGAATSNAQYTHNSESSLVNGVLTETLQISQNKQGVIPKGTVVSFSVTDGYPLTTKTYCGRIVNWNGGSYDIQVNDRLFQSIPESSIVRGC